MTKDSIRDSYRTASGAVRLGSPFRGCREESCILHRDRVGIDVKRRSMGEMKRAQGWRETEETKMLKWHTKETL